MSFSNYLENELLDHLLGGSDYSRPATVYVALSKTAILDDFRGLDEPSGGAYARVSVTNNVTEWPAASGGKKSNANDIVFTTPTADWGTCGWFALMDASSGGNGLAWGPLLVSKTINDGETVKFLANQLEVFLD